MIGEDKKMMQNLKRRKMNWIEHEMNKGNLLIETIEVSIEVMVEV